MCGIFAYIGSNKKAGQLVFNGLKKLEYRGYDSWGVAIKIQKSKSKIQNLWTKKCIGKIGEARIRKMPQGSLALGHTRWATHGGVTVANAHPHLDCLGQMAIVHNGIIENYQELKKQLQKNHRFLSQTDTEVMVHLIEELKETKGFIEGVRLAFKKAQGLNAMIVLDGQTETMVAAKTGSPLVLGLAKSGYYIASDFWALLPYTKKIVFLEDGQMAVIQKEKMVFSKIKSGKKIKAKIQTVPWQESKSERGRYPHFMIKEISEQPRVISHLADNLEGQVKQLAKLMRQAKGVFMVGCGTAAYATLAGQYLFSKIAQFHVNPAVGSEFTYHADFLTPNSLVIALSQSGETIDIIEAVQMAKKRGAKVVALVNVLGSSLYRLADDKILLTVGSEKCVLATKSFTAKLAILLLTAYSFSGDYQKGQLMLQKAAQETKRLVGQGNLKLIKLLVNKIYRKEHMFVIGRGQSYPVALEAALKIKEGSYLHAEGFAAGELKHGVIALVEKGTPCLVFAPNDETYGAVISGAMEMKARGGFIIGVSFKNNEIFDFYLPAADCSEATFIPNVVMAQLLGYYLTLKRGYDPDKPRNLAKSVTVK